MVDGVTFALDDGETLNVPDADLRSIYDLLWELAEDPTTAPPGALSTAALLADSWRLHPLVRRPVELNGQQTAVLREIIAQFADSAGRADE